MKWKYEREVDAEPAKVEALRAIAEELGKLNGLLERVVAGEIEITRTDVPDEPDIGLDALDRESLETLSKYLDNKRLKESEHREAEPDAPELPAVKAAMTNLEPKTEVE